MTIYATHSRTGRRGSGGASAEPATYDTVYARTTSFAYSAANLTASGGVNAHTARHAKSGYVVLGRGPTDSLTGYINACAAMKAANPAVKILHYVMQSETLGYREVVNTANEAAMLALQATLSGNPIYVSMRVNDTTYRTDLGKYFRCTTLPGTSIGQWVDEGTSYPAQSAGGGSFTFEGVTRSEKFQQMPAWMLRRSAANGRVRLDEFTGQNLVQIGSSVNATDGSGRALATWLAQYYIKPGEGIHAQSTLGDYVDGLWIDNCKVYPTFNYGYDLNDSGVEDTSNTGNARIDWAALGNARFITALRAIKPTALIHGNSQFSDPQAMCDRFYSNATLQTLDGGMYEQAMRPAETTNGYTLCGQGWTAVWNRYKLLTNALTGSRKAISLRTVISGPNAYQAARLGICTALLGDGQASVFADTGYTSTPPEFDEYLANLGAPIEALPAAPVSGTAYTRKYENGIVIVNGASQSGGGSPNFIAAASPANNFVYTPPSGVYRHITATQDATANPQDGGAGAIITGSVTVVPWDGRILLCVTPGVHA